MTMGGPLWTPIHRSWARIQGNVGFDPLEDRSEHNGASAHLIGKRR